MVCGIALDQIAISYQDELQDYEVTLSGLDSADSPTLYDCLAGIMREGVTFTFENPDGFRLLTEAYNRIFGEADRARAKQDAERWLAEQGLLGSFPRYDTDSQNRVQYARSLEQFCAFAEGSFLLAENGFVLTAAPEADNESLGRSLRCLTSVLALDDAGRAQIGGLGFIGNEAAVAE